jgi:hypothetical protein
VVNGGGGDGHGGGNNTNPDVAGGGGLQDAQNRYDIIRRSGETQSFPTDGRVASQ